MTTTLNNLGTLYYELGDYDRAESFYLRAIELDERYNSKQTLIAKTLNNLAILYSRLGDYTRAESLYLRVLQIENEHYGSKHGSVATGLNNLAALYNDLGAHDEAERIFLAALSIQEEVYGADHPIFALTLNNLAEVYVNKGNYADAESLLQTAFIIAMQSNEPKLLWNVQHNYSKLLATQNRLSAAIFFAKQAVNILQALRKGISEMDKELQQSFVKNKMIVYRHLASLLIDKGRLPEAQQVLAMLKEEEFFDFTRRNAQKNVPKTQAIYNLFEQPLAKSYQEINSQLAALGYEFGKFKQKKKAKIRLTKKEKVRYKQLRKKIKIAKKAFKVYLKELKKIFKKASTDRAIEFGQKNLNILIKLQGTLRELGEGVVLLHYLITKNKLYIIVTTPFIQLVREVQIDEKKLNQEIRVFRHTLKNLRNPTGNAETLYNWILKPIIADLEQAKAKTLMLSLDGTLRYIPIAALYNGESEEYVAERYAIVNYTEAGKDTLKDDPVMPWTVAGLGLSEAISGCNPLPHVVTEIESIVRRNKEDQDGVLKGITYFNQDFDADTMLDVLDEGYPVMHIASHFEFKLGTDQNSFLLLGNGEELTLAQIEEEDYDFNNLDLLTLSACNTAMGDRANGREIEGFAMLAQNQGAKSVLASLWSVYDESTGEFMQKFYQKNQSLNKAQALQQVQKYFIEEGEYEHPFYWAPFILIGNWL
jgi:CHAT domain-containing protein/Flp pilus assembly protein TadD